MEPDETSEPTYFSCFTHGVDEKRRVQIPAPWRPAEPGLVLNVILWPKYSEGPCLRVLPPSQMTKLSREVNALPIEKKVVLKRFIGSESVQMTLDKAGRICLPADLAEKAGIEHEAVFVAMMDRFEIWSPSRWEKRKAADSVLAPEALNLME